MAKRSSRILTPKTVLGRYYWVDEVKMPRKFAYVYSKVENVDPKFWMGVTKHELTKWFERNEGLVTRHVSHYYRPVKIPKRKGGFRELNIPNDELKEVQHAWLEYLNIVTRPFTSLSSYAFEKHRSVIDALKVHSGNYFFLKCDIKDAFPSVRSSELLNKLRHSWHIAPNITHLIIEDCYFKGLPQGAPTSGKLFNMYLVGADTLLPRAFSRMDGKYTRYADDIVVSFPINHKFSARRTLNLIQRYLNQMRLSLNLNKTRIFKGKAKILGCIIHEDGKITLSRKKRRLFRAMIHNSKTGKRSLSKHELNGIKGWLHMIYENDSIPGVEF